MKNAGVILFGLLICLSILSIYSVSAKFPTEQQGVTVAYQCLYNITNKSSLSLEEAIFTTFALGFNNASNMTFNAEKSSSESCWPNNGCSLKRTAQVGIAYDFLNRNISQIEKWIISKNATATGIEWFLEIDIENQLPTTCTVREDTDSAPLNTINIGSDQKISGNPGSCFSLARDGYLLRVSESCLEKTFEISCNEDFLTTLLYKKSNSETYYVSAESHTSAAEGTTTERMGARCFKTGGQCDYEGSLWAAVALQQFGRDVTPFVPYLLALADEEQNKQFLPVAFAYILTESSDSYSELTQSQQQNKYWRAAINNSRLFDTSLAMLALQGTNAQEVTRAKTYLLDIQDSNGCWNNKNIRDTAFILYAGWPQPNLPILDTNNDNGVVNNNGNNNDGSGSGTNITSGGSTRPGATRIGNATTNATGRSACEMAGFSCSSAFSCLDAGGILKSGYGCTGRLECCSVKPASQQSCSIQQGKLCNVQQRCQGNSGPASDGSCCFGTCVAIEEDENLCESGGYGVCGASCSDEEYDSGYACNTPGFLCCTPSTGVTDNEDDEGLNWGLIILLIILIGIIIAAIMYREQLKLWWFKMQNKKQPPKSGPFGGANTTGILPRRPPQFGGFLPRPQQRLMPSRPGMRPAPRPAKPQVKDKELEETLKKLKEMSE